MSKLFELLKELGAQDGGASLKIQSAGGVAVFTPRSEKSGTTLILAEDEERTIVKLSEVLAKRREQSPLT